jgi:hypothetical protein
LNSWNAKLTVFVISPAENQIGSFLGLRHVELLRLLVLCLNNSQGEVSPTFNLNHLVRVSKGSNKARCRCNFLLSSNSKLPLSIVSHHVKMAVDFQSYENLPVRIAECSAPHET